jgi:hypothetical protein
MLFRNRRAVGSIPTRGPCAAFFPVVPGQVLKCVYILTWITNPKNSIQKMKTLLYDTSKMMTEKSLEEQSKGTVGAPKAVV